MKNSSNKFYVCINVHTHTLGFGGHFSVLAFPCNQFGDQEPLDIDDIVEHVTSEYDVEFPIFSKVDVVGEKAEPAFRRLVGE